jgi:hypothetical protein
VNWISTVGVAGAGLLMMFALLRVERQSLWIVLAILVGPALALIVVWASLRGTWAEVIVGLAIAVVLGGAWWGLAGRKMPTHRSADIKVWEQEKLARPRPEDLARLQAENRRLKEEAERIRAELRRLKGQAPPDEN